MLMKMIFDTKSFSTAVYITSEFSKIQLRSDELTCVLDFI